jgi:hypothetical protein
MKDRLWRASVLLVVAACGGCAREIAPPGFEPASTDCPSLVGDYVLSGKAMSRGELIHPGWTQVDDWATLSIEPDAIGKLQVVLRRAPSTIGAEAAALRKHRPERYSEWRRLVRVLQGDLPVPIGVPSGEGAIASIGPALSHSSGLGLLDCDGGWVGLGHRAPGDEREPTTSLSRNAEGALLIRRNRYRESETGFNFFGQNVTWSRYAGRVYSRLEKFPGGEVRFRVGAVDAPLIDTEALRKQHANASMDASVALRAWLEARRSSDMTISILRPVQFDPQALRLAAGVARIEVAGTYGGDAEPNPYQVVLRGHPAVSDLEVRKHEARAGGRHYTLLWLTIALPVTR